ncbi:hypothetical protein GGR26_002594 [Lewinella marina]|uniref:Uncharacterized protein n=1 Tax=Neolewinella marina TaxID=438751 RepID=A0A2G0CB29_9BACT|nr:hypothetical protein [Neolewinella marina]NJB86817.1 hypothetical protein [Neolewinella marina]PHK97173.1 hypothetical protein CGL56_17175 [Neolewinella marina]
MRQRRWLYLLLLPLFFGCADEEDIRDYYYPVRELTDGLVYAYQNTGDVNQEPFEYWYYLGLDRDTALYLSATRYANGITPVQVSTERVRNEGIHLEQLTLYPPGPSGQRQQVETEVLYDRVFPFYPNDGLASGYRVRFRVPENSDGQNFVSLNRYYRRDTTLTVLGEERRAVVFDLRGEVSQRDPELGDISPTFTGYEIYAEGLGLVEYRRDLGAGGVAGARLVRRMPMSEFAGEPE